MQPIIETERLVLRGWTRADIAPYADMNRDPRVMEFFQSTIAPEQSYDAVRRMEAELEQLGYGWFVMERKAQPGFCGVVALCEVRWDVPFEPKREIGWRLPVFAWGHGYATEAAAALLDFARDSLRWNEVVSFAAARNERSQRVMQRIGMTRDVQGDFDHPRVTDGNPLRRHVLYRKVLRLARPRESLHSPIR